MGSMAQFFPVIAALHEDSGYGVVAYDWLGCGRRRAHRTT
jgi:hypothetical protein